MATTTAKTKKEVDEMSNEDRLWDSLSYSYGKKGESLGKEYDKAVSQQDRALLGRGMQRSSAGMSTLAGLRNQKAKALDDNNSQLIADYENRLQTLREAEEARKFQTSEREAQQAWQSGENELARAFQTSEREAQQLYNTSEREAQQKYNTLEREAQQGYNTSERIAQQAFTAEQNKLAQEFNAEQAALDREQNQGQFDAQLAFNREEAARDQGNKDIAQAFAEKQFEAQQAQWREEFDYNKMSDDQKLAYNYIVSILGNGGDPSDELLARAGLSREDANAMKAQVVATTSKSGNPGKGNTKPWEDYNMTQDEYNNWQASGLTLTQWRERNLEQGDNTTAWYEPPIKYGYDALETIRNALTTSTDKITKSAESANDKKKTNPKGKVDKPNQTESKK